jgi:hypothetical protein
VLLDVCEFGLLPFFDIPVGLFLFLLEFRQFLPNFVESNVGFFEVGFVFEVLCRRLQFSASFLPMVSHFGECSLQGGYFLQCFVGRFNLILKFVGIVWIGQQFVEFLMLADNSVGVRFEQFQFLNERSIRELLLWEHSKYNNSNMSHKSDASNS